MKCLGGILLAVCAVAVVLCSPVFDQDLDVQWQTWKMKYNKRYQPDEEEKRRNDWVVNNFLIEKHNAEESLGLHSYRLGLNRFTDMGHDEFVKTMTMRVDERSGNELIRTRPRKDLEGTAPPPWVDYRKQGQVTSVKDQGSCLSSYAFSAIGSVEALYYDKFVQLVNMSAQNIIDCSDGTGNFGCSGGSPYQALMYMLDNGIENSTQYPYTSKSGKVSKCKYQPQYAQTHVSSFISYQHNSEQYLQQDIATNGPMAACIDGSQSSFKNYKSGIYNDPKCKQTSNHCVLIVGYNATDTKNAYYIVKNSWGTDWGMEGYIYMSMFKSNQCGIASNYSYADSIYP